MTEKIYFTDSHCHLNNPKFDTEIYDIIDRATHGGVRNLLNVCTDLSEVPALETTSDHYHSVFHTVGVHPHEIEKEGIPSVKDLISLAQHSKAIGFGETGLDYYYDHTDRAQQKIGFCHHIHAASSMDLPLIIHNRSAEEDMTAVLQNEKSQGHDFRGVLHCFTGTQKFADACLKLGLFISISGIITFKSAGDLIEVLKTIPLNRLLIETDAPYLAPVPFRGKRNEPSYIIETAKKIAEIKNISVEDVAIHTTQNFFNLFSKAKSA